MDSMRAHQYVAIEPLDEAPSGPWTTPGQREEALSDALRGLQLGAWDEQFRDWLIRAMTDSALRTIICMLERVRIAGAQQAMDAENALRAQRQQTRAIGRHGVPGNAGPSFQ